jgi:molybdopterin converting factor small subunit
MATVFIPAMLREFAAGNDQVQVNGTTVRELIDGLRQLHPALVGKLIVEDRLVDGLTVAVDGVVSSQGLRTPVEPASEVHFLPVLGGGSLGVSNDGSHRITAVERMKPSVRFRQ